MRYAVVLVVAHLLTPSAGCAHRQEVVDRATLAAQSTAYGLELDRCVETSKTYAAYENCAKGVDTKYGAKP